MDADTLLANIQPELRIRAIHSAGPGGQNVNKVATAMQLRFDVSASEHVQGDLRERFIAAAGNRMTRRGELVMTARRHRTQTANRRDLMERLQRLLHRALQVQRPRLKRGVSRAQQRRRLDAKKRQGQRKRDRQRPDY